MEAIIQALILVAGAAFIAYLALDAAHFFDKRK